MFSAQQVRPGIWVGFTGTETGNLAFHVGDDEHAVILRRAALNAALSQTAGSPVSLAFMNQVHGNVVATISESASTGEVGDPAGSPVAEESSGEQPPTNGSSAFREVPRAAPTADAMVSTGAALAVMVADCVPVVLVGDTADGGVILAVAHAGRPGVEADVVGAVVASMRAAGAGSIEAWLGPSVCGQCYEVPETMRAAVARKVPASFATTSWGTPALDLPAAVLAQLGANNVSAHASGECTLENPEFYSHRRSMSDGSPEGRFIGFAVSSR